MAPETAGLHGEPKRLLQLTALGLLLLFGFALLPQLLGVAPLDPSWQLALISALLGVAIFPLLALSLLGLARGLEGRDSRLLRALPRLQRLGRPVALGFLLLLPVQIAAMARLGARSELPARREIARLQEIRQAIAASADRKDLAAALRRLPGSPQLPAGFDRPLGPFRQELDQTLERGLEGLQGRLNRQIQARRFGELAALLRVGGMLLVFAALYAEAGGLRLLRQARELGSWLRHRGSGSRRRSGGGRRGGRVRARGR